jgi:biopolymer transport protein ExbB
MSIFHASSSLGTLVKRRRSNQATILTWLLAVATLLAWCQTAEAWWNDEWQLRKKITLDTSASGANITDAIGTVPVLVRLHVGNFRFGQAKEDGGDLRFIAADDKTPLKHHIEKYDSLLGEAFVWVQVPDLPAGAKTDVWLYYGNKKAVPSNDAKGTYDADTLLVYHFAERGTPAQDSSVWANGAQSAGQPADGAIIGTGLRLDGQSGLIVPASPSLALPQDGSLTWSAWVKPAAEQPNAGLYSRRDGQNGIVIGFDNGAPFVEVTNAGTVQRTTAGAPVSMNVWHHLAVTAGSGVVTMYVDGNPYATLNAPLPALNTVAAIGGSTAPHAAAAPTTVAPSAEATPLPAPTTGNASTSADGAASPASPDAGGTPLPATPDVSPTTPDASGPPPAAGAAPASDGASDGEAGTSGPAPAGAPAPTDGTAPAAPAPAAEVAPATPAPAPAPEAAAPVAAAAGFVGDIDEMHIAKAVRTPGYLKALAIGQGPEQAKLIAFSVDEETSSWLSGYFAVILRSVTIDGWVVIGFLLVLAVISWFVMFDKASMLKKQTKANARFTKAFRAATANLGANNVHFDDISSRIVAGDEKLMRHSSLFQIYQVGAEEIAHRFSRDPARAHVLGAASIAAIRASLDAVMIRESQKLNRMMVMLTIAISGGPFLGLLGTVVGVMITFAAIAASGDVNVNAIAPGIAAALVATVAGLGVAIPALFGYNYLISRIKDLTNDMQVFVDEFITRMAETYAERPEPRPLSLAAE